MVVYLQTWQKTSFFYVNSENVYQNDTYQTTNFNNLLRQRGSPKTFVTLLCLDHLENQQMMLFNVKIIFFNLFWDQRH